MYITFCKTPCVIRNNHVDIFRYMYVIHVLLQFTLRYDNLKMSNLREKKNIDVFDISLDLFIVIFLFEIQKWLYVVNKNNI